MKKTSHTRFILITIVLILLFSCTDNERYHFAVVGDFQQPDDNGYKKVSHEIVRQIAESRYFRVFSCFGFYAFFLPLAWFFGRSFFDILCSCYFSAV